MGDKKRIEEQYPFPWAMGAGYEQNNPGYYIHAANGLIVISDDTLPDDERVWYYITTSCNERRRVAGILREIEAALVNIEGVELPEYEFQAFYNNLLHAVRVALRKEERIER